MKFPKLCEPIKIGNLELKNRMVMAPMSLFFAPQDGSVTDRIIEYYRERALGGIGLIITECVYGNPGGHPFRLHIWHDKYILGLKTLADAVHRAGGKVAIQINMNRGRNDEVEPLSASGVPNPTDRVIPKVIEVEQIKRVVDGFGEAVRRARESGFDAVEIHGAGGYLVEEFLSPLTNKRSDEYGGDVEKRARLVLEMVKCGKAKAGTDYPIYCKFAHERINGGFATEDAIEVAKMMQKLGVEAIEVASGNLAWSPTFTIPPMARPRGLNTDFSAEMKHALTLPVIVTGRINDPAFAERVLQEGKADLIGLGRPMIADPEFAKKVTEERPEEIRKCLACNHCSDSILVHRQPVSCSINTALGKESEHRKKSAKIRKEVLVVGGGIAGMETARLAASLGHTVTLWEKSKELGGMLNIASRPPYKEELRTLTAYLINQLNKLKVHVECFSLK